MKRVLFIDRDGTLIEEPDDFQVDSFAKLRLVPGVVKWLGRIAAETDYELVMVSNQDGLGTASLPSESFYPVHEFLIELFRGEGIEFKAVHIDGSLPGEHKPTRKPGTGMLTQYFGSGYDLANSFVIGDRETDVELAINLGSKAIFLSNPRFDVPAASVELVASSWEAIYNHLTLPQRRVEHSRKTNETQIRVALDLDGRGEHDIQTGIPFFDHMLEQLARHASLDLAIAADGDLHIDEHHTIEDVAITLGEAFTLALGDKRGIERYGFTLPMDDCLAQVAVDFGGRNWIVWNAEFKRETIGQMPTEMFFHFFKSFSDAARCNLNISATGTNEHHKIESIFKAFARAIKGAVNRDARAILPTTKGLI